MRRQRVILSEVLLCSLLSLCVCAGEINPNAPVLVIRILDEKAWKASKADVSKVLHSTAGELLRHFPGRELPPIEVRPRGGPITLFERGPQGEIRVNLDTGESFWAQYAFQFAHEMGHILCNYNSVKHRNKWFEESLCELASMFALRRMAENWAKAPPYPNWKDYANHLSAYADERMKAARLPDGQTLAKWYADNAETLGANATDRPRNTVAATALLPLFEAAPDHWQAVAHLNTENLTPKHSFAEYLEAWRRHCPEKHKAFVEKIAGELGIELGKE